MRELKASLSDAKKAVSVQASERERMVQRYALQFDDLVKQKEETTSRHDVLVRQRDDLLAQLDEMKQCGFESRKKFKHDKGTAFAHAGWADSSLLERILYET